MKKTIKSVAKELNLAPSTISKALNNKGYVKKETKDRILSYVKEIGYIQESSARILKSKHSFTLGVLFSDISLVGLAHPFYSYVLQAFKNYVEKQSYEIIFIVSKVGDRSMTYLEWCKNKKVDGVLIVSGNLNNPNILELVNSDIYCVSTDFILPNLVTVISDNETGIDLSIEHSLSLNRRKIDMISGPLSAIAFQIRHNHFLKRMANHERKPNIIEAEGFDLTAGFNAAVKLLESTSDRPDMIIVGSDDLAFGVIRGIESKGLKVPDDISVIGFDDNNFAKIFTPPLTTIRQDKIMLGEVAARKLLELIRKKTPKTKEVVTVPVTLVKRETTTMKIS